MFDLADLSKIGARLYIDRPEGTLYHYTSVGSGLRIIEGGTLYATHAQYLNDQSELKVFVRSVRAAMSKSNFDGDFAHHLHQHLGKWLDHRMSELGPLLFVACLTQNGNLLSQWRSYGDARKGISIGFNQDKLATTAQSQGFIVGRCIYDAERQVAIAREVLDILEARAAALAGTNAAREPQYPSLFLAAEACLLSIAVLFKDAAFREEDEWRLVSPIVTNYANAAICFREGRSMLTPYMELQLPKSSDRSVDVEHVWLGPTPHVNAAMSATSMFFTKMNASPRRGISYSNIPYRTT
jgi:hypothetical protein